YMQAQNDGHHIKTMDRQYMVLPQDRQSSYLNINPRVNETVRQNLESIHLAFLVTFLVVYDASLQYYQFQSLVLIENLIAYHGNLLTSFHVIHLVVARVRSIYLHGTNANGQTIYADLLVFSLMFLLFYLFFFLQSILIIKILFPVGLNTIKSSARK